MVTAMEKVAISTALSWINKLIIWYVVMATPPNEKSDQPPTLLYNCQLIITQIRTNVLFLFVLFRFDAADLRFVIRLDASLKCFPNVKALTLFCQGFY